MSVSFEWIRTTMERYAPERFKEEWDNIGLLLGETRRQYERLLTALDVTDSVIDEAEQIGADMIIAHHPIIFKPVAAVTDGTAQGARLMRLIGSRISVFCAHTNLDAAVDGTNGALFDVMGLEGKESLEEGGIGCVGMLPAPLTLRGFAELVKARLNLRRVTFAGNPDRMVRRVALCAGSGAAARYFTRAAEKKCDVYLTGDLKYHAAQEALDMGLAVVDGTHYGTEIAAVRRLCGYLRQAAEESGVEIHVSLSRREKDVLQSL
ncbi:MAG: Nif3-like dinuclear metal center hexameric protein [Clostridiales bacterium]|jgi:dinuclear metal center YbgI/SA1388 family protein|nr:Nif3-like dinuclear metal center hexameric protein [Clostridiales bacterium]